ncbi:MAG: heavy metal translocating P-type ATPase [Eubacteriales bacterium]|nr:heavy metal translocating P-type ATPase [Eubacteriales bacterium]
MTKQTKIKALILLAGAIIYGIALATTGRYQMPDRIRLLIFLAAYLLIGFEVFRRYRDNLMRRRFFDENLLMILATVGAFGVGRYIEANAAMLLFEVGVIFEAASVDQTKRRIADTIDIRPEYATRKVRGKEFKVEPSALKLYNLIVIKPGERVPVDSVVVTGTSALDTKALTGEAMPRTVGPGDAIYSGSINLTGVIEAKVTALYKDSTVSRIMEMVEKAQENRTDSESFITTFSKYYSPVIAVIAVLVMIVPSLTFAPGTEEIWIYRGLVVLIAACPAGLVLSTPVAFLGGIASAARQGILVKGGSYLEDLAKADTFIFDKTGTLTEGVFKVQEIKAVGMTEGELLKIAAHVESYSNHPIAQSLRAAYNGKYDKSKVKKIREEAGYGVNAVYDGEWVHIGNHRMAERYQVETDRVRASGSVLYVIIKNRYAGYIVISDTIKKDAARTLDILKEKYQAMLVMLTGDGRNAAIRVAKELQMDYAYADLMPNDKLELVEEFLTVEDSSEKVACVGDGINDAPILARADVGIAMGALGSAAAIEAADVVLMDDELPRIIDAIKVAKETMRVVSQNISFAMAVKVIVLALAALGYITMWGAVFADLGVMLISIINAAWVVKYSA